MKLKRIVSAFLIVLVLCSCFAVFADAETETENESLGLKAASYDEKEQVLTIKLANKTVQTLYLIEIAVIGDNRVTIDLTGSGQIGFSMGSQIEPGGENVFKFKTRIDGYDQKNPPVIGVQASYGLIPTTEYNDENLTAERQEITFENVLASEKVSKKDAILNFINQTGFAKMINTGKSFEARNIFNGKTINIPLIDWQALVMLLIACVLIYLAIVKKFEPLLLLPIAFGMLLTNLVGADMFHEELFADGHVHWDLFKASNAVSPGLIDYLYLGVKLGIYPCLIFVGVGAMTDFGPLIANPKSLLLGAAAQIGIFATYLGAYYLGFTPAQAGSIGIIGGADGPTAIFTTSILAPELLGPIAVAAYSYMALVPVIQPPIMKALTTKEERMIVMKELRPVSKTEKIIFPIVVTVFVALLVPSAAALIGCLMLGNLLKESGVCDRLSKTVQNELMNIVTIFLGISVGATATASTFLSLQTIKIIIMGVVAFGVATASGVLIAKLMNLFLKDKINPLIGSAGVSAVPMAARVSQKVGQEENPGNFLLMHAMGPNVAGVIGSAIAAGALIAMLAK